MIALAPIVLALLLSPPAVPLEEGQPAPFAGVLVSEERLKEILQDRIELDAAREKLAVQAQLRAALMQACETAIDDAAKAGAEEEAAAGWYDDPGLNRWIGFFLGVGAGVGALYGGAVLAGSLPPPGS